MRARDWLSAMPALAFCVAAAAAQEPGPRPRITVGPNVRASDLGRSHVETYIAAHPDDPDRLVIVVSHALNDSSVVPEALVTKNGGRTWSGAVLPGLEQAVAEGRLGYAVDNWVAFGPDGVGLIVTLGDGRRDDWGGAPIFTYRSEDGGDTWRGPVVIPGGSFDRLTLGTGGSKTTPRFYIAVSVMGGDRRVFPEPRIGEGAAILRSDDSGRSFRLVGFLALDNLAHQPMNPIELADGTLLMPYDDYPRISVEELQAARRDPRRQLQNASRLYVAPSADFGATFGLPRFIADIPRQFPQGMELALDRSSGPFHDRLYAAWNGGSGDQRDVSVAYSRDGGSQWRKTVLRYEAAGPAYFYSLAVSPQGVLGVSWIQHDRAPGRTACYRVYFTASVDGGETFSAPVVVSDAPSCPEAAPNRGTIGRWPRGNDYMGLAAARDGSFHPVWIDARDGAFQAYTTRILVSR
jgi:hypothetical protein